MHINIVLLGVGIMLAGYGGSIAFSRRVAAYIDGVSLDKRYLPPEIAKYTVPYVEAPLTLAIGAALILAAFVQ